MGRSGYNTQAVTVFAGKVADEVGFDQLTLARLAQRMKIRTPSLYAHVQGLDDLRRRIAEEGAQDLGRQLSRATAGLSREEALVAIADTYRGFARKHPGRYEAVERGPAFGADPAAMGAPVEPVVAVVRGYGLSGDDEIHAVRIIRAALHGFISLEAGGGFALKLDLDDTFARLVATLHRGLAA